MKKEKLPVINQAEMINWKSFLDNFYQPIIISDKVGNHLYVNKAACKLTGYSEVELLNIGMRGLADPERIKELSHKLKKRLNDDPLPFSYDFKIILKDGSGLAVNVNGHKIKWGDQTADLIALYNISSRKKDEDWYQVKNEFSLRLNKIFSTDLCLQETCRLIEEEHFYKKSLLVIHNKNKIIVNCAYKGIEEQLLTEIRNYGPLTKEHLTHKNTENYKIAEGYFFPDGRITEFIPNFIDISGQQESYSDLNHWQPGDVLFVPLYSETNDWIGHLSVGNPFNGKRPDIKTVRKLQELLYILSRRLTELKQQELISESEKRYRMITEQSILPIAVFLKDRYIFVNKAFSELSGYSNEEILSWNQAESRRLIHPDDLDKLLKFDRNNNTGHSKTNKLLIRGMRKSGEIRWLERYSKKINYYGTPAQLIILLDRTKEVLAERKLQVSEEHFRTLLGATKDSVLLIDKDGLILNLNKHYADLMKRDIHTLRGTYVWDLFTAEGAKTRKELVQEVIRTKQSIHINETQENQYLKTNIYPIFSNQNEVQRIAVYIVDITEEMQLSKKLLQAEKMAAVGNITSGIVHQIRNPLGNISFAAQLGLELEGLSDILKEYLELILNDVEQANFVIEKLVEYNDPYAIELKKGNILVPVYKAISLTKPRIEAKNIELSFDHPDELPELKISEYWLEHIFLNIINNAIQAIKKQGKIEIRIYLNSSKTNLMISVKDNGCGIPENKLSQVYDPFFTTKKKGVGLGLSLVSKIVELHKGSVKIDSKVKEFTVVTVTLPIKQQKNKYYKLMSFPF